MTGRQKCGGQMSCNHQQYTMVWRGDISQTELAYVPYSLDIIMKNYDIHKQFRQNSFEKTKNKKCSYLLT